MKITSFALFFICLVSYTNSNAQAYQQLIKADSLAAVEQHEASIQLIQQVLDNKPRNFLKSQAYIQLSHNYLKLYDFEKAYDYNNKSLAIRDQLHYEFIADNYQQFGMIEFRKGKVKTALDHFLEARDLPHADLQFSGILDSRIAACYEEQGDLDLALENYKNSLEILSWELEEEDPNLALANEHLGRLYTKRGETEQAIFHYEQSILSAMKSDWGTSNNLRLARANNALGVLLLEVKKDKEEARKLFEGAYAASGNHQVLKATALYNLAYLDYLLKNYEKANQGINELATYIDLNKQEGNVFSNALVLDKKLYANALTLESKVLLEQYATAQNLSKLTAAYEKTTLAVALISDSYHSISTDQWSELYAAVEVYETAMTVAMKSYKAEANEKYLEDAFSIAEQDKIRANRQAIQAVLSNEDNGLISKKLKEKVEYIEGQSIFFESDLAFKFYQEDFQKKALNSEKVYQAIIKVVEKQSPKYYALNFESTKPSIAAIQEKLKPDEALLYYVEGADTYFIFSITKEQKEFIQAPLNSLALGASTTTIDLGTALITNTERLSEKSDFANHYHVLYQHLIAPIKNTLKKKKRLIIVPHHSTHQVDFELLLKKAPGKRIRYHKLPYLINDFSIRYANTAKIFFDQKALKEGPKSLAIFHPTNDEVVTARSTKTLKGILKLFENKGLNVRVLNKTSASEENFKTLVPNYNHLYLATSNFLTDQYPKLPGLNLVSSAAEDGLLEAKELIQMDLSHLALVFVNQNNLEGLPEWKEVLGLAGAQHQLTNRGTLEAPYFTKFMSYFYKKVLKGASYDEALKYAQLKTIKKQRKVKPLSVISLKLNIL